MHLIIINEKDKNKLLEKENELFDKEKIQRLMRNGALNNVMILQQYAYQGSETTEIPMKLKNTELFP